jgi:hypothetical protein
MMFQTYDGLYLQASSKRHDLEKQASLERQLRQSKPSHPLRIRLASTLHHMAARLAPEYSPTPRMHTA